MIRAGAGFSTALNPRTAAAEATAAALAQAGLSRANGALCFATPAYGAAYPMILLSNHIGGTVRVKVTIASNGTVEDVELIGGNPILAEAAMAAVKKWVYAAGRSRTQAEISIPFDASR